ncbi:MAG: tRNA epoxyqueuosine(34) reductase QueG [Verrucomicrobiales bacterium]|nr:tRNA epoxyqueuosine(34) reductase QueG [Verrucomicrobiales bacterium]
MTSSPEQLKANVQTVARNLGFAACRIAVAKPAPHADLYRDWIAGGTHGDMDYLAKNLDRRTDPRIVVPGARSVIVLATNYFQGQPPPRTTTRPGGTVARYAWGDDYHSLIEPRLRDLEAYLHEHGGETRGYVDTGPVLERDFATEAGLGWNGKSTLQLDRQLGTWFFLSEIITTLTLPPDAPEQPRCGTCTACITACPTGAIVAPQKLDARRCISYLTIEHKGDIPEELRPLIGDRIYGCDDCLTACPWNRFAQASNEASFQARDHLNTFALIDYLALTDEEFRALFRNSPVKRSKRPRFLRNVCVALGNVGTPDDLPALSKAAADPDPLIASHATWAIAQVRGRHGIT